MAVTLESIEKELNDTLMDDAKTYGLKISPVSYEILDYNDDGTFKTFEFLINGDWKHDHGYFDSILEKLHGFVRVDQTVTEDTGSDWYEAVHKAVFLDMSKDEIEGMRKLFA